MTLLTFGNKLSQVTVLHGYCSLMHFSKQEKQRPFFRQFSSSQLCSVFFRIPIFSPLDPSLFRTSVYTVWIFFCHLITNTGVIFISLQIDWMGISDNNKYMIMIMVSNENWLAEKKDPSRTLLDHPQSWHFHCFWSLLSLNLTNEHGCLHLPQST